MSSKKIFITGATGLLGAHILAEFIQRNSEVYALYRNRTSFDEVKKIFNHYNISDKFGSVHWMEGDIFDTEKISSLVKDGMLVIHAAGMVSFNPAHKRELLICNSKGTANIVNICLTKKDIRFCHISSIAVFQNQSEEKIIDENLKNKPDAASGYYHLSKYLAEMEVWRAMEEGLNAVIVNPGLVLSGFFHTQSSGKLVRKALKSSFFYPTGTTGMIFATDAARAIAEIALSDIKNERFILIENNYSYKHLFDCMNPNKFKFPLTKGIMFPFALSNELLSKIFRIPLLLSRRMVQSACATQKYDNKKLKSFFPHLILHPLTEKNVRKYILLQEVSSG